MTGELELMAGTLFRIIEGRAFWQATTQERANYIATCKQFIDDVRAEQARQEPEGQKAGAA